MNSEHKMRAVGQDDLQVLLVEDGSASTSACSLEIKVGNFLDPPHLPGTAILRLVTNKIGPLVGKHTDLLV